MNKCGHCQTLIEDKRNRKKFCTRQCYKNYRIAKKTTAECIICDTVFYTKPSKITIGSGKYCSRSCQGKSKTGQNNGTFKHGRTNTSEYVSWRRMKDRCFNPNNNRFEHYGGRGITVCDRWLGENGFINFLADMGEKPTSLYSIDRIDADKGYMKGNCRWATSMVQNRNKRSKK
jgi:hypothetical protein